MTDVFQKLARRYRTPEQVQKWMRRHLPYNRERKGPTLRSAEAALKAKTAHCFEATFVAAAILERHGYPPLVVSMESKDGLDHVIYVFKERERWGAIARSRDEGLHGRPPVFRSIRDLVWSYYDPYVDKSGKITAYQIASLDDTGADWRRSRRNVWRAERYLLDIKHVKLRSSPARFRKLLRDYIEKGPLPLRPNWW